MSTFSFSQPDEASRGSSAAQVGEINNEHDDEHDDENYNNASDEGEYDEEENEEDEGGDASASLLYYEGFLYTKYVGRSKGRGLFMDEAISAGEAIIAEHVLWISEAEQNACTTSADATLLLTRKLKAMGHKWTARYIALAKDSDRSGGNSGSTLGKIWDAHSIPTVWGSKRGAILGHSLAWINHSCTPNCTLTLTNDYPFGKDGQPKLHAKPRMGRAILRAAKNIPRGTELTIGYFYPVGCLAFRGINCYQRFGFYCDCSCCNKPAGELDKVLERIHRLWLLLQKPELITTCPAGFFHVAFDLEHYLARVTTHDIRRALTWTKCALVAGFHSDLARVDCFLCKARQLALLIEGPLGKLYQQLLRWTEHPDLMPGFGVTTRGLSTYAEASIILDEGIEDESVLYMTGAKSIKEYIRVSQYELIQKEEKETDDDMANKEGAQKDDKTERPHRKWRIRRDVDEGKGKARKKHKHRQTQQPQDELPRAKRKLPRERCATGEGHVQFLDVYMSILLGFLEDGPDLERVLGRRNGLGKA